MSRPSQSDVGTRFGPLLLALLLAAPAPAAGASEAQPVVAVFAIQSRVDTLTAQEVETLTDYLGTKLGEGGRFLIMPREEIRRRLRGQKQESYKSCYEQTCQIELGRELAAQFTVAASIGRVGSSCLVTAALYDLAKAATHATATARSPCDADSLLGAIDRVAGKLTAQPAATPPGKPPAPQPQPAARVVEIRPQTPAGQVVYVPAPPRRTKSAAAACLWGLLLPGGGLFYAEEYAWGGVYLATTLGAVITAIALAVKYEEVEYFLAGWGAAMGIDILAIVHGMVAASKWKDPAYEAWKKSMQQQQPPQSGAVFTPRAWRGEPAPAAGPALVVPILGGRF